MKLYEHYCPECPRVTNDDNIIIGRDPKKCRYCTAEGLADNLACYIEAQESFDRLKEEIVALTRGLKFYNKKIASFRDEIAKKKVKNGIRVYRVGTYAVVLDDTEEYLHISYAGLEDPK